MTEAAEIGSRQRAEQAEALRLLEVRRDAQRRYDAHLRPDGYVRFGHRRRARRDLRALWRAEDAQRFASDTFWHTYGYIPGCPGDPQGEV